MGMEFTWLVQGRIRYHRFWGELTMAELAEGVQIFIDLNEQYSPQPIHIVVDLREVSSYSLSIVQMYSLALKLNQVSTGYMVALGSGTFTMQTFLSAAQLLANPFNLPYIYLADLSNCARLCKMRDIFSNHEIQQITRLVKSSPQHIDHLSRDL